MQQLNLFPAIVVFTGPCQLASGQLIVREALERATRAAGMKMATAVKPGTAYVVASRFDTKKAREAAEAGLLVLTYDQYVRHLADLGVNALDPLFAEGATFNKIVDTVPAEYKATDENGAFVL